MSKKHKPRAETPAPQTAQVDAVERLLEEGRMHEAAAKAERLARQFPDHVRLRDLHIRALASSGELPRAALLAEGWTRTHPNSQRAWNLLFGLSADLGLGYLAHACHQRLDVLGATDTKRADDAREFIEAIRAKYKGLDDDEGLRSDRGLLFLIGERLQDAVAELSSTSHPVPRTNLAAAHFDLGDMPQAIDVARQAWSADEANTHAARILARALLYTGDETQAREVGKKLRSVQAREPDELAAQLETLDLLEDYDGARARYEAFPGGGFENFRRDMMARMRHAAAVAFFNLGQRDRARVLWREAVEDNPRHPLYEANLMRLMGEPTQEPAWLELMSEAFPASVAGPLHDQVERAGGAEALLRDPSLLEMEMPGHSLYLGCLLRQTDPLCRTLAREALADRLGRGDAQAEAELRRFLTFGHGDDQERVEALRALYFEGRLAPSGSVTLHQRGALRTLEIAIPGVQRRPPLPGLPAAAQSDYFDSVFAARPADMRSALEKLRKWRDQATEPLARKAIDHRLILMLHGLPGREAEGEALLREALATGDALPRTHAFAARLAVARGDLAAAQAQLDGQLARCAGSDEDIAPVLVAQAELHAARGETDAELAARIAHECLGAVTAEGA